MCIATAECVWRGLDWSVCVGGWIEWISLGVCNCRNDSGSIRVWCAKPKQCVFISAAWVSFLCPRLLGMDTPCKMAEIKVGSVFFLKRFMVQVPTVWQLQWKKKKNSLRKNFSLCGISCYLNCRRRRRIWTSDIQWGRTKSSLCLPLSSERSDGVSQEFL